MGLALGLPLVHFPPSPPAPGGLAWCKYSLNWQHGPARMQGLLAGEALGAPVGEPALWSHLLTPGAYVCAWH